MSCLPLIIATRLFCRTAGNLNWICVNGFSWCLGITPLDLGGVVNFGIVSLECVSSLDVPSTPPGDT
jgi:hypothetical protein